jgi:hypothetical protein
MAGFPVWAFATEVELGPQEFEVYREKGGFHLLGEATFQKILSMRTAAERDRGGSGIGRLKKGKAGQVVPVRMGEEKTNLGTIKFLRQEVAEIAYSRTCVDNNNLSAACPDLEACGVAAVA